MRLSFGLSDGPFGTAHETSTPSTSSRKSQCMRVARCCCTTKVRSSAADGGAPDSGSGVFVKSRFCR